MLHFSSYRAEYFHPPLHVLPSQTQIASWGWPLILVIESISDPSSYRIPQNPGHCSGNRILMHAVGGTQAVTNRASKKMTARKKAAKPGSFLRPITVAGAASKDSQSLHFLSVAVPRPVAAVTTSHPRCT